MQAHLQSACMHSICTLCISTSSHTNNTHMNTSSTKGLRSLCPWCPFQCKEHVVCKDYFCVTRRLCVTQWQALKGGAIAVLSSITVDNEEQHGFLETLANLEDGLALVRGLCSSAFPEYIFLHCMVWIVRTWLNRPGFCPHLFLVKLWASFSP